MKKYYRAFVVAFINAFFCGTHFFSLKRFLLKTAGMSIGTSTKIVGPLKIGKVVHLDIGDGCWIGADFTVHGNGTVHIGDNCDFGPEVSILTGSHEIGTAERRAGEGIAFTVTVGNGCWIGARATIMGDTTIGGASVVAACALVNKDVEQSCVVGGVPAKLIKELKDE